MTLPIDPRAVDVTDLEQKAGRGDAFVRADADRLLACPDLIRVGMVGEAARRAVSGDRVTFGRVCSMEAGATPGSLGQAGEVRLVDPAGSPVGSPLESIDETRRRVRDAASLASTGAPGVPLTGFSLDDLLRQCGGDHLALAEYARALRAEGLEAVAAAPLDAFGDADTLVEVVRAVMHGGLGVWRLTVEAATLPQRLELILQAQAAQDRLPVFRAFAPLPRRDAVDAPSTGYDDVRTIAVARAVCRTVPCIQVDWPLHGPKLAQVAIAYGANDVDGIAASDTLDQGPRRAPRADIIRQIQAASAVAVERDGRYEALP